MKLTLQITGETPLLMHNARLSNPLDEYARAMKKISAKRSKTDEDYTALARLEFLGGLYHDSEFGPFVPAANIARTLQVAARKRKLGVKVTTGLFIREPVNPLVYNGPRDPEKLWDDVRFRHEASVKVGTARVIRTRPMFKEWLTSAVLDLDTEILDLDDLTQIVEIAGSTVGLGDWRPTHGRFVGSLTRID